MARKSSKGVQSAPVSKQQDTDYPWLILLAVPFAVPVAFSWFSFLGIQLRFTADVFDTPKLMMLAMLVAGLAGLHSYTSIRDGAQPRFNPVFWLAIGLLGWSLVSATFGVSPSYGVFGSYSNHLGLVSLVLFVALAYYAMQYVKSPDRARDLAFSAVLGGAFVALYGLMQVARLDAIPWQNLPSFYFERGWSTIGNPNTYGGFLVAPLVMAPAVALSQSSKLYRSIAWGCFVVIAAGWLMAFSRGAWLAGFVGLALLGYFVWRNRPAFDRVDAAGVGSALVLAAGALALKWDSVMARFADMTGSAGAAAGSGRLALWESVWNGVGARWLLGYGPDSVRFAFFTGRVDNPQALGGVHMLADDAHNIVLTLAATIGIPGMLIATALVAAVVVRGLKTVASTRSGTTRLGLVAWYCGLIAYIGFLLTGPMTIAGETILWMAIGVLLAARARSMDITQLFVKVSASVAISLVALAFVASGLTYAADGRYLAARTQELDARSSLSKALQLTPWQLKYRLYEAEYVSGQAITAVKSGAPSAQASVQQAQQVFEALIADHPWEYDALVQYADMLNETGRVTGRTGAQRALEVAQSAMAVQPNGVHAKTQAAAALIALGRPQEAVDLLSAEWNKDPAYAEGAVRYAQALKFVGRTGEAVKVADYILITNSADETAVKFANQIKTGGAGATEK